MRITFVLDAFGGGGKERRCLQVIQGLNREGIKDIQVIIINNNVAYRELFDTSAAVTIIDRKGRHLSFIQTAYALYKLLKMYKPDLVQVWGFVGAGLMIMVKPFLKCTLVASYVADADRPKKTNSIINQICKRISKKVISNSKAGLIAYRIPRSKSVLIYNGFNEARYRNVIDKETKKTQLEITTKYVVAMVAAFWKNKDWQCFIDAAKEIIKQRKDITFLAVGQGPQWTYYNNQIDIEERRLIRMMGRRDDVDELFQICDLTVLTSFHGEGVSNSIMESMAWGVPVIATNNGGTPEIIDDNKNGRLINNQTTETVAAMIEDLVDNDGQRTLMGDYARQTVKERFLLQRKIEEYIELYQRVEHE